MSIATTSDATSVEFASPVTTTLDELIRLQSVAAVVSSYRRRTAAKQQGTAPSKHFGRGLDFAEVREYHAGDEVRMMDWNVTARTGRAHIKVFMEERERPVIFLVDQTPSMQFGTRGMFKSAMAVRLAALLGWCALNDGDRIGGVVALPSQIKRIKPAGQRRGLLRLFQTLIARSENHETNNVTTSDAAFLDSLQHARAMAPSGCRLVLISDFLTINSTIEQEISGLLKRVEVIPICVHDALEHTLPPRGILPVRSRQSAVGFSHLSTAAKDRRAHTQRAVQTRENINDLFASGGQAVVHVQSHEPLLNVATRAWFGVQPGVQSSAMKAGDPDG